MTVFISLIRREWIEHKAGFLIAPLIILGLMIVFIGGGVITGRFGTLFEEIMRETGAAEGQTQMAQVMSLASVALYAGRVLEIAMLVLGVGWLLFLVGLVFFYCADAFSADSKNNAMLFWKSMPVSDATITASKFATATVLLPLINLGLMMVTGLLVIIVLAATIWSFISPDIIVTDWLLRYLNVSLGLFAVLAMTVLWYLPFVAWVSALSTIVGRWAIPLSLLIPATLVLAENLLVRIQLSGGVVWQFLSWRMTAPNLEDGYVRTWLETTERFDAIAFITDMIGRIDWLQVGIGAVFSIAVLWAASEYRRRRLG